jgi:hypothetical protein
MRVFHFISIALLAGAFCFPASASTALSLQPGIGTRGEQHSVPAVLQSDQNVVAVQFEVGYQSGSLKGGGTALATGQTNHLASASIVGGAKTRVVLYSPANAKLQNGLLADLLFQVVSNAPPGTTALNLSNAIFSDANGNRITGASLGSSTFSIFLNSTAAFDSIVMSNSGVVEFHVKNAGTLTLLIEASADLMTWTQVGEATAVNGQITFQDPSAAQFRHRFYRLIEKP